MAQRQVMDCDSCFVEVGTPEVPVIYVVVGSLQNGEIAEDVKLPAEVWDQLANQSPRREYCPACFSAVYGAPLVTLLEHEIQQGAGS